MWDWKRITRHWNHSTVWAHSDHNPCPQCAKRGHRAETCFQEHCPAYWHTRLSHHVADGTIGMTAYALQARSVGIDTIQLAWGDHWNSQWPPLVLLTSNSCIGRQKPLLACIESSMVRSGLADLPCECNDATFEHHINRIYLNAVEQQVTRQQPPKIEGKSTTFAVAGMINCAVQLPETRFQWPCYISGKLGQG